MRLNILQGKSKNKLIQDMYESTKDLKKKENNSSSLLGNTRKETRARFKRIQDWRKCLMIKSGQPFIHR